MTDPTPPPPTPVHPLRDIALPLDWLRESDVPPDATIALYLAADGTTGRVAGEIQRLQRGEFPPVRADIDQLTAFIVICFLESVLRRDGADQDIDRTVRRFIGDLEAAMHRSGTSELVGVLEHCRRQQPKGGRA